MLTVSWNLSYGILLDHLYVASPGGCLGFFTAWWLPSKNEHPKEDQVEAASHFDPTSEVA